MFPLLGPKCLHDANIWHWLPFLARHRGKIHVPNQVMTIAVVPSLRAFLSFRLAMKHAMWHHVIVES